MLNALFQSIIHDLRDPIVITDADTRIVYANKAFLEITNYTSEQIIGQTPHTWQSGRHDRTFYATLWDSLNRYGAWEGEIWNKKADGEVFPAWVSIRAVKNNGSLHYYSTLNQMSEVRSSDQKNHQLAYYDSLTGLPNRHLFRALLDQAIAESSRTSRPLAVLFIDLNRFKPVNDTYGHEAGDELLKRTAQRIKRALRPSDCVCRWGGDEFVIGLFEIFKREHVAYVATKVIEALERPIMLESTGLEHAVGAAIGIGVFPGDGGDAETLIRMADIAMYRAKKKKESHFVFSNADMNEHARHCQSVEADLRLAITKRSFVLHYQPKISIATGKMTGVEALIRLRHPVHGILPPSEFISVAEETGLIAKVSEWVITETMRQLRSWRRTGVNVPIAINLSAHDFGSSSICEKVITALRKHGVQPEQLELEITEGMLVNPDQETMMTMENLVGCGIALSIDDFGTGYSNLAYLKNYPISTIKIDRRFVTGLSPGSNDVGITAAIIGMARHLRCKTVAEGVETAEQFQILKDLGCTEVQGYLFSPPVTPVQIARLLRHELAAA